MNRKLLRSVFSAAAAILLIGSLNASAAGGYYRWLDSEGNTVLSDRLPPEGVSYEVVSSRNTSVRRFDSEAETQQTGTDPAADPAAEIEAKVEKPSKKDPANCAVAKKNLSELSTSARIRMPDGKGGYRYLEDGERETERLKASKAIEVYCE